MSEDDDDYPSRRHTIDDWEGRLGGEEIPDKPKPASRRYLESGSEKHKYMEWALLILFLLSVLWLLYSTFY